MKFKRDPIEIGYANYQEYFLHEVDGMFHFDQFLSAQIVMDFHICESKEDVEQ
jgi:hypothetical protein